MREKPSMAPTEICASQEIGRRLMSLSHSGDFFRRLQATVAKFSTILKTFQRQWRQFLLSWSPFIGYLKG